jgi:malate synthase
MWCAKPFFPPSLKLFFIHFFAETSLGPPTPSFVAASLTSDVSMTMIDFEDSMTFTLDNQMNGMRTVTKAADRSLKIDLNGSTIDFSAFNKFSQILIRMEGLALPNPHFLVDSLPVPMHLVTVVLFLFHNWKSIIANGCVPAFYIPKLETMEEAAYCAELFSCIENELAAGGSGYPVGSVRCFVIMENVWSAFQKEEILYALREYVVGMNAGWHDYCASVGAAHASLPLFTMPPKKNLRLVVEHLHDYHLGIVNACMKRGAIPIGGMNGMVPPPAWAGTGPDHTALSRIRECFEADFWVQVKRGLRGVWMADVTLAALMRSLIEKAAEQGLLEDHAVPSYTPAPDRMLVAHLQPYVATYTDIVQNVSDAVQYLASFLTGNGNPGLTALHADGVAVRNMEDAATLERSRREIWAMVAHSKPTRQPDGSTGVATRELVEQAIEQVMRDINHRGADADVPLMQNSKPHYDTALILFRELVFSTTPVDYFSVLALRYCVAPARSDRYFLSDCFASVLKVRNVSVFLVI